MLRKFSIFNFQFSIKFRKFISSKASGFTLIEIVIAGGIFALVSVFGVATMSGIYQVHSVNLSNKAQQENTQAIMDAIAREVRLSDAVYIYESKLRLTNTNPAGPTQNTDIYQDTNNQLMISRNNGAPDRLSSGSVKVDNFSFIVSSNNDWVLVNLRVSAAPPNADVAPLKASSVLVPRKWKQ